MASRSTIWFDDGRLVASTPAPQFPPANPFDEPPVDSIPPMDWRKWHRLYSDQSQPIPYDGHVGPLIVLDPPDPTGPRVDYRVWHRIYNEQSRPPAYDGPVNNPSPATQWCVAEGDIYTPGAVAGQVGC